MCPCCVYSQLHCPHVTKTSINSVFIQIKVLKIFFLLTHLRQLNQVCFPCAFPAMMRYGKYLLPLLIHSYAELFIPVTNAAFCLDVLQMKLCPGVGHGFGLFNCMFPCILSQRTNMSYQPAVFCANIMVKSISQNVSLGGEEAIKCKFIKFVQ